MASILGYVIAQESAEGARRPGQPCPCAASAHRAVEDRLHRHRRENSGMIQLAGLGRRLRLAVGLRAWSLWNRSASPPWLAPPFFDTPTRPANALIVRRRQTAGRWSRTAPTRARTHSPNPILMSTERTPSNIRPDSWAGIVLGILRMKKHALPLPALYELVERKAKKRLAANPTWKATVRRTVQDLRDKDLAVQVEKGVWQYLASDRSVAKRRKSQRPSR